MRRQGDKLAPSDFNEETLGSPPTKKEGTTRHAFSVDPKPACRRHRRALSRRRIRCAGRQLSEPQHHAGAAVCGRQRHRHHDAADLAAFVTGARRRHRHREQGGRQRHDRRDLCRARRPRRLHAAGDHQHHAFGQSLSAQKPDLRSGQGLHPDRAHRRPALHAGDPPGSTGQDRRRAGRLRQGQSRQAELRLGLVLGDRVRRDLCAQCRARPPARALQELAAGAQRRHGRPRLDDVRGYPDRPAPRPGQRATCARCHDQGPLIAGCRPCPRCRRPACRTSTSRRGRAISVPPVCPRKS
ncbi:hypothetical protein ACVW0I_007047 [Bradyrhizobium sp. LM6.11]